ncbi:hypothetical protein LWI28_008634 [Acer negundo]|uniref:Derlin n=1 Tax=Acer negundo TaxID=4023 RepID=A0AAD5J9D4_ACENE|nr:hypothetical protein LWI28_008634 [Acer negundo]
MCVVATAAFHLGLYSPSTIALIYEPVFSHFQALAAIPMLWTPFLGVSLVFMLIYVWSREYPNAQINIYGLVTIQAFYLPWAMLAMDVLFGASLLPDLLGIIAGHLYYFLTVLHPLAGGRNILKTPKWVYPSSFIYMCYVLYSMHCIHVEFLKLYDTCINLLVIGGWDNQQLLVSNQKGQPVGLFQGGVTG